MASEQTESIGDMLRRLIAVRKADLQTVAARASKLYATLTYSEVRDLDFKAKNIADEIKDMERKLKREQEREEAARK